MKQCPTCKNTYTDESLKYCLADGTALMDQADHSLETIAFHEPVKRVDIPIDREPPSFATIPSPKFAAEPVRKTNWAIIGILISLLIIVVLGFAGFAAYIYFKPGEQRVAVTNSPSPTPSASATKSEDANLQEKIANLEKRLEDQKATPSSTAPLLSTPKTARANSPGDGFLALRSEPNTETGERLAKIPHGGRLTVIDCPKPTNPGKIRGRWCRVNYEGIEGWAFDSYMIFD